MTSDEDRLGEDLEPPQEDDEVAIEVSPDDVQDALDAANRAAEVSQHWLQISEHIGPLPSPEVLEAYDDRFPGLGRQIVAWTDSEIRHRQRLESDAVGAAIRLGTRGQFIGLLIVLVGAALIYSGREIAGLGVLIPVVIAFIGGQISPVAKRLTRAAEGDSDRNPDDDEN